MPKVLLITGPGGAGKSTIAKMIARDRNFVCVDGDREDTEFFPDGDQWLPENKEMLKKAHRKILQKAKELINTGKSVIVDYIIFGEYENFAEMFKKEFGDSFAMMVLFPSQAELIKRDRDRECWTTGPDRIAAVYKEFESAKKSIGAENYLDTSAQTPEETVEDIFSLMDTNS
ncbi:MAG: AAA family ATPase [Candidatus Peregrinibacteria bacterium]